MITLLKKMQEAQNKIDNYLKFYFDKKYFLNNKWIESNDYKRRNWTYLFKVKNKYVYFNGVENVYLDSLIKNKKQWIADYCQKQINK